MGKVALSPKVSSLEKVIGMSVEVALAAAGRGIPGNMGVAQQGLSWHQVKTVGLGNRRSGFSLICSVTEQIIQSFCFTYKKGLAKADA